MTSAICCEVKPVKAQGCERFRIKNGDGRHHTKLGKCHIYESRQRSFVKGKQRGQDGRSRVKTIDGRAGKSRIERGNAGREMQQEKKIQEEDWWRIRDLNPGPMDYDSTALTTELIRHEA